MLIGAILGIIIALFAFGLFWQYARIVAYKELNKAVSNELTQATATIQRFMALEQERRALKESIVVNFTEEQITNFATKISVRVRTMMAAEQDAALSKLN